MLHLFLFILKIIGIILAALLGLLLLILLLLLFVPIRYRGQLTKEKELEITAKGTWLLHMVSVPISFRKGALTGKIKVFGITVKNFAEDEGELKETAEELFRDMEEAAKQGEIEILKAEKPDMADGETEKESVAQSGKSESPPETASEDRIPEKDAEEGEGSINEEKPPDSIPKHDGLAGRVWRKIKAFFLKIFQIWKKIKNLKYTFRRFCVKIRTGIRKYKDTKEFLLDQRTKAAVRHCMDELKLLLRKLLPKRIRGELCFGTEDPALTGEILGGIGIFYPVFKDNVKVYLDFQQSVLEGELFVKGSFRLVTAALILWRLWRDKNVRYVYHRFHDRE